METTAATTTTTQQRAVCPACFATQAVKRGRLVAHGYTRPQHWHQNIGTCPGAGEMHFGTEAGRDYTATTVAELRASATDREAESVDVAAGRAPVYERKGIPNSRHYTMAEVATPTARERAVYAANLARTAEHMRAQATEFEALVAAWTPREPLTLEVEKKTTLVHWYWERKRGKACAGSYMGAQKGYATVKIANVTCEKCKALAAKFGGAK